MTTANNNTEAASAHPATEGNTSKLSADRRELFIERILDAPRELVFKAWTNPKHITKWWGPKGFTNPVVEMDVRPGGKLVIHMADPDGNIYPMTGVYLEVVEPERLVIKTNALEGEDGNSLLEGLSTVTFADYKGKTKMTLHEVITKAAPAAEGSLSGMEEGWNQSLDSLTQLLATL